jgi:hypothetical protein
MRSTYLGASTSVAVPVLVRSNAAACILQVGIYPQTARSAHHLGSASTSSAADEWQKKGVWHFPFWEKPRIHL